MDKVYKTFDAEIEVKADGTLVAIMSTDSIDRDGEVLDPKGWNLKGLETRPPLIANHDYGSGGLFGNDKGLLNQIGHWEKVHVDGNKLIGEPHYYVGEGNEQADWGYKLATKGVAKYSVGFIPRAKRDDDKGDGIEIPYRTYTRMDLLECSHVIIPSNADAVVENGKAADDRFRNILTEIISKQIDEAASRLFKGGRSDVFDPEEADTIRLAPVSL